MKAVKEIIKQGLEQELFTGSSILVADTSSVLYEEVFGFTNKENSESVTSSHWFDLASLTKPLMTATVLCRLIAKNRISLENKIIRHIPEFGSDDNFKNDLSIQQLLRHSSGLPGYVAYYEKILSSLSSMPNVTPDKYPALAKNSLKQWILQEPLEYTPDSKSVYSDLGFMILGWIIEKITGKNLDKIYHFEVLRHLPSVELGLFNVSQKRQTKRPSFVSTSYCDWRKTELCGEVYDDHAYLLGGMSGHAGLFGTARGVYYVANEWMQAQKENGRLLDDNTVQSFIQKQSVPHSTYQLGWDSPSPEGSQGGNKISQNSIGHLGYTGTSLWIDLEREKIVVFLTNRVHYPDFKEKESQFKKLRVELHDLVWAYCDSER